MNYDKITVDVMMDFLEIDESTRKTKEVRETVQKLINMMLPTIAETTEFQEFYNRRFPDD